MARRVAGATEPQACRLAPVSRYARLSPRLCRRRLAGRLAGWRPLAAWPAVRRTARRTADWPPTSGGARTRVALAAGARAPARLFGAGNSPRATPSRAAPAPAGGLLAN